MEWSGVEKLEKNYMIPYFSAHCISDHCISDQKVRTVVVRSVQNVYFLPKFWAKIPWSEAYKNCLSDQIQWSEMTKIFDYYYSLKMLCQIII